MNTTDHRQCWYRCFHSFDPFTFTLVFLAESPRTILTALEKVSFCDGVCRSSSKRCKLDWGLGEGLWLWDMEAPSDVLRTALCGEPFCLCEFKKGYAPNYYNRTLTKEVKWKKINYSRLLTILNVDFNSHGNIFWHSRCPCFQYVFENDQFWFRNFKILVCIILNVLIKVRLPVPETLDRPYVDLSTYVDVVVLNSFHLQIKWEISAHKCH